MLFSLLLLLSCWEQSSVESPQHDESLKSDDEAAAAAAPMSLKGGNGDKNEYKKVLGSTWEYSGSTRLGNFLGTSHLQAIDLLIHHHHVWRCCPKTEVNRCRRASGFVASAQVLQYLPTVPLSLSLTAHNCAHN